MIRQSRPLGTVEAVGFIKGYSGHPARVLNVIGGGTLERPTISTQFAILPLMHGLLPIEPGRKTSRAFHGRLQRKWMSARLSAP